MRLGYQVLITRVFFIGFAIAILGLSQKSLAEDKVRHTHQFQSELNLTVLQQTKLDKIEKEYSVLLESQRTSMSLARRNLETALQSSDPDEQIKNKFDLLRVAEDQFAKTRFNKILQIRALLTPDQRSKFNGMTREGSEKRRHRN